VIANEILVDQGLPLLSVADTSTDTYLVFLQQQDLQMHKLGEVTHYTKSL